MENKSKLRPSGEKNKKGKSKCPICNEDATLVCGGCQSVSYCCADHQKKHWKLHQSSCVFFHIKDDPSEFTGAGKFCVASRDLKAGTIILEELPIFQMPTNRIENRCITCGVDLPPKRERNASNNCPKCHWPVCGTACAEFPLHAANECQVFVANKIPYPNIVAISSINPWYPLSMRAYAIMIKNPERWKEVVEMLDWRDSETQNPDNLIGNIPNVPVTLEKLTSGLFHFPNMTEEDEVLLMGILQKLFPLLFTQGYETMIQEESAVPGSELTSIRHRVATYVYKIARHFVHSCSPNCSWTVGSFPDFKMQIRTSVAVKKGEKLTVSRFIYDPYFAHGTRNRQQKFQTHFHLPCRCDLCLDPTEFGTNQSAVVCEHCKKTDGDANSGFSLPINPLNIADDAQWKCNKCRKITIASKFCGKLQEITVDLQNKCHANWMSADKVCEAFIEMYRNKLVHPNHWIMHWAVQHIRNCQLPRYQWMNVEELLGFEKLMNFLLDLKDKTLPGINFGRIWTVFILSRAMCRRLLTPFDMEEKKYYEELSRKSKEHLLPILVEIQKCEQYQKEILLFFKHLPNNRSGNTVDYQLSALRDDMQSMEKLKFDILSRLAEIDLQRLRLGIN